MKVFTGAELMKSFGGLAKSLEALERITKGHVTCERCGGTGWREPTQTLTSDVIESDAKPEP